MSPLIAVHYQNCSGSGAVFCWFHCCYKNGCSAIIPFILSRISESPMSWKRRLPPKALLFFSMCHSGLEYTLLLRKTAKTFQIKNIMILCGSNISKFKNQMFSVHLRAMKTTDFAWRLCQSSNDERSPFKKIFLKLTGNADQCNHDKWCCSKH